MDNVKDLAEFVWWQLGATNRGYNTYQLDCTSTEELEETINAYLKKTGSVLFKAMQVSEFNDDKYA